MTYATTLHLPRTSALVEALSHRYRRFVQARARARAYRGLLAEFARMSAADWQDLGQSPLNARELARQTVWGA